MEIAESSEARNSIEAAAFMIISDGSRQHVNSCYRPGTAEGRKRLLTPHLCSTSKAKRLASIFLVISQ